MKTYQKTTIRWNKSQITRKVDYTKLWNRPPDPFLGKVFWKYAPNLKEKTHAEVWFNKVALLCFATLLRSLLDMDALS